MYRVSRGARQKKRLSKKREGNAYPGGAEVRLWGGGWRGSPGSFRGPQGKSSIHRVRPRGKKEETDGKEFPPPGG